MTFSNEGSVTSVLLHKHHEINGEIMLVSKAYSGQQWKQWQLEKEINEVRMLKSQGIVHADDEKATQIVVKIPNRFKDCIDTKKLEEYFSIYGETEETLSVYHLPKKSGNFGWNVNGKTILVRPTGKFPK